MEGVAGRQNDCINLVSLENLKKKKEKNKKKEQIHVPWKILMELGCR